MVDVFSSKLQVPGEPGSNSVAVETKQVPPAKPKGRHITWRGEEIPVIPPSIRDLRLRLSATILAIQICGQTVLNFKISIAQILITMIVAGIIELVVTFRHDRVIAWPASALQSGASVAFILRASGTQHGDLWSLRGIHFFIIAAVLSLMSKYLVRRPKGRHIFNPSNVGIVAVLIIVGPRYVFSEHLWWDSFGFPIVITLAVILIGGYWILKAVRMLPMAFSFLATFAVFMGIFALTGRHFYATWRTDGVSGMAYWLNIALSPEVIAYVFFMISDPQTSPKAPRARILYGMITAAITAALVFPQTTEFAIKVSILASLTFVCALVPAIERLAHWTEHRHDEVEPGTLIAGPSLWGRLRKTAMSPALAAAAVIAVAAPIDTVALVANKEIVRIERDLPPPGVAPGAVPLHNPHRQ